MLPTPSQEKSDEKAGYGTWTGVTVSFLEAGFSHPSWCPNNLYPSAAQFECVLLKAESVHIEKSQIEGEGVIQRECRIIIFFVTSDEKPMR